MISTTKNLIKYALKTPRRYFFEKRKNKIQSDWLHNQHNKYLYYGNLGKTEHQYSIPNFMGLALYPSHEREFKHDATLPLAFQDNTITKIQSQDVFEHLEKSTIPFIFDEIYRVLKTDGVFRLSLPDYRSSLLKSRSVYDSHGKVIADLMMGASVSYDEKTTSTQVHFLNDGNAHLWFPTYEEVLELIESSKIKNCRTIKFYQYYKNDNESICENVPDEEMFVMRSLPHDMRASGKPISIIIDFIK